MLELGKQDGMRAVKAGEGVVFNHFVEYNELDQEAKEGTTFTEYLELKLA